MSSPDQLTHASPGLPYSSEEIGGDGGRPDTERLILGREEVITAFELLLGRLPENEAVITHHRRLASRVELGETIRGSAEFQSRHAWARHVGEEGEERATQSLAEGGDCTVLASYRFAAGENGVGLLRDGWSEPEAEFCWSDGLESGIELPVPPYPADAGLALTLRLVPFQDAQRVSLAVGGVELLATLIRRPAELACAIPPCLLATGEPLRVTLHHPDASRPSDHWASEDHRLLALGLAGLRLATLPVERVEQDDAAVLRHFESLGDNCEFGFVQQRNSVFAGGLLRFNTMPTHQLLRGLATGFERFPDRSRMRLERHPTLADDHEYIVYEDGYGLGGHTSIKVLQGGDSHAALLDREHTRLTFLKRLLIEELENGETIFVFKRNLAPSEAEVMALWLGIRRFGRCSLLWVVPEAPGLPAGSLVVLAEGLLKGYIDRFAPYADAEDFSLACWLTICRRALRFTRLDLAEREE